MQLRTIAIRAVKIAVGPKLSCDASALAIALVTFEALLRKRDLHPRIRSLSLREINLGLRFDDERYFDCALSARVKLTDSVLHVFSYY